MPDHLHMAWMGLSERSDQLNAIKHFRSQCNESLSRIKFQLQDQAYDHVLKGKERYGENFRNVCHYIALNPERAGLVEPGAHESYKFTGCLVPGYPELRPFAPDYWNRFDRIISFLRKEGLMRT